MAEEKTTEYAILIETDEDIWFYHGTVTVPAGTRASTARREGLAKFHPEGGNVVAIPADDWVAEDLKPKLTFG